MLTSRRSFKIKSLINNNITSEHSNGDSSNMLSNLRLTFSVPNKIASNKYANQLVTIGYAFPWFFRHAIFNSFEVSSQFRWWCYETNLCNLVFESSWRMNSCIIDTFNENVKNSNVETKLVETVVASLWNEIRTLIVAVVIVEENIEVKENVDTCLRKQKHSNKSESFLRIK